MTNATAFWGAQDPDQYTCGSTPSTDQKTCNGNGDGQVNNVIDYETGRFWQQLANAGLIQGSYNGVTVNYGPAEEPVGRITDSTWYTVTQGVVPLNFSLYFPGNYGGVFEISSIHGSDYQILSPAEAWNIDTKMDDGMPGTGTVLAEKGNGTTTFCTNVAGSYSNAGAVYNLTLAGTKCWLFFTNAY